MTSFERAVEIIDRKIDRACRLGIRVSAKVAMFDSKDVKTLTHEHSWTSDRRYAAASINKLAIALYVMDKYRNVDGNRIWPVRGSAEGLSFAGTLFDALINPFGELESTIISWGREDVRAGAGRYDNDNEPRQAPLRFLLVDMLKRSGNTAMVVLGRHHVDEINVLLRRQGLQETQLIERKNGFFETGFTTATEALKLFQAVVLSEPVTEVAAIAATALSGSRSHVPLGHRAIEILSKHGELNGADNDGTFVRHEVGMANALSTTIPLYSVLTQTDTAWKAKLAEQIIGQIGATIMGAAGMRPPLLAPFIGKVALMQ